MAHADYPGDIDFSRLIERYAGTALDDDALSSYEQFALNLFHNREVVADPNLEVTVQLDITDAARAYDARMKKSPGATMTAFLSWCVIQAMKRHEGFSFRRIGEKWYRFENLPLFFPVAVGGMERFNDMVLHDVCRQSWPEFCKGYRARIDAARGKRMPYEPLPLETWHLAHFIGNLPNIQFTHFSVHRPALHIGRPVFYFGRRYAAGDRTLMPLFIQFDHSNLDPHIVGLFLEDLEKILATPGE